MDAGVGLEESDQAAIGEIGLERDLDLLTADSAVDGFLEFVDPFAGLGTDRQRAGVEGSPEGVGLLALGDVDLIQQQDLGFALHADIFKDVVHRAELLLGMRVADVKHVQEQVGMDGLLERRLETGDQVVRQVADETDRVAEHHLGAALQSPRSGFGVERGEEFVVGISAGGGDGVEERALACVRVADDADREMLAIPRLDQARLALVDYLDLVLELADALAHQAAVGFELGFTGAASANAQPRAAAGDALEVAPHAGEARVSVLELRELDLELCFVGLGAAGEDVEDQLAAIEHHRSFAVFGAELLVDRLLQRADLAGGEVIVEQDDVGLVLARQLGDLDHLAAADERGGIDLLSVLHDLGNDARAGGLGETAQFAQRIARVGRGIGKDDPDQDRLLLLDGEFGSFQIGQVLSS